MIKTSRLLHSNNKTLIHRRIDDVYQFVAVDFFQNYQKWSPEVRELEQTTDGAMRVGVTGRQVRFDHGYRSEASFLVTQMTSLKELRFTSMTKPDFEVCYGFEPSDKDTVVSFEFKLRLPLPMLPFRHRIAQIVKQGGSRVVSNIRTLLHDSSCEQ